jgi:hypothetical protein
MLIIASQHSLFVIEPITTHLRWNATTGKKTRRGREIFRSTRLADLMGWVVYCVANITLQDFSRWRWFRAYKPSVSGQRSSLMPSSAFLLRVIEHFLRLPFRGPLGV